MSANKINTPQQLHEGHSHGYGHVSFQQSSLDNPEKWRCSSEKRSLSLLWDHKVFLFSVGSLTRSRLPRLWMLAAQWFLHNASYLAANLRGTTDVIYRLLKFFPSCENSHRCKKAALLARENAWNVLWALHKKKMCRLTWRHCVRFVRYYTTLPHLAWWEVTTFWRFNCMVYVTLRMCLFLEWRCHNWTQLNWT